METGTAIISAILLGISIIPFIIMRRSRARNERQRLQSLTNLASHYNCQISQHEICGNAGIAIDNNKNVVLFYEQTKDKVIEEFIDLSTIERCIVNKTTRTNNTISGENSIIDRLELSFSPIFKNKPIISLEFFNIESSSHLNGELQIAEKWSKLINARL